jgi:hypothetical protein
LNAEKEGERGQADAKHVKQYFFCTSSVPNAFTILDLFNIFHEDSSMHSRFCQRHNFCPVNSPTCQSGTSLVAYGDGISF